MAVRYGFSGCDVEPLCHSENRTYLVSETGDRHVATFRICRPGYRSLDELHSETCWLSALRRDLCLFGVTLVEPLAAVDGSFIQVVDLPGAQRLHGVAFTWMQGANPDESDSEGVLRLFGRLGDLAARMHACAASNLDAGEVGVSRIGCADPSSAAAAAPARPTCSSRLSRPVWDCRTCLGPSATWGDWRAFGGIEPQVAELLARCEAQVRSSLAAYGAPKDRTGLIHADMRLANLLVSGETLGLLDFDDCGFSWHLFDLAASLSFIEARPDMPALADSWLDAYRRVRPLRPEDLDAVPSLVMLRRLQLTGWLASRHDSDPVEGFSHGWLTDTLALADRYLCGTLLPGLAR